MNTGERRENDTLRQSDEQYNCSMPAGEESLWSSFSIVCVFTGSRFSGFILSLFFILNLGISEAGNVTEK